MTENNIVDEVSWSHKGSQSHPWEFHPNGVSDDSFCPICGSEIVAGKYIEKFKTPCPRCGGDAFVTKTKLFWINDCTSCGFQMANKREDIEEEVSEVKLVSRFGEKDIWCLGCCKYHYFDMSLRQVACRKEHPMDYPQDFVFDKKIKIEVKK